MNDPVSRANARVAEGQRVSGVFSLGDFSLDEQREVTRSSREAASETSRVTKVEKAQPNEAGKRNKQSHIKRKRVHPPQKEKI